MIKFPYGISDFYQVITENYLYVDRTDRIPVLEEAGKTLLFLRPRRFGKSLLLSMLENYYDVNKAPEFDRLFGGLAIGRQPTPLRNRYLILRWDFSDVVPHPDIHQMQQNLFDHINDRIKLFAQRYAHLFKTEIEISRENAMISFRAALRAVETTPYKLYLLLDEYDNFANEVLMGGRIRNQERYESLVFSEGAFKSIFKSMKAGTAGFGVDRMMIVGVSPMVLHDVTSGFNIAENIYFRDDLTDLCGFTEDEITGLLHQTMAECKASEKTDEAQALMRTFYNGYCFSDEGGALVYNPTAALSFLKHLQRTCAYPRRLLDSNLAPDYQKISYIAHLPKGREVILHVLNKETRLSVTELDQYFDPHKLLTGNITTKFIVSLFYYLGALTFGGITASGELILRIPNLMMRSFYETNFTEYLLPHPQS
ncbi:MAG: AAA family ATPase [Caldilinea sp. CFX5]|nr:AAA family ATPase [Caldilinea sp. CFX5]